ncbi:MAG: hypothetical protein ACF8R9_00580 [Phycisphaerales bacterium JB054]
MLRVLMAGVVGGMVLVVWSAVFAAVGPVRGGSSQQSALASVMHDRFGGLRDYIPLGPASAMASSEAPAGASSAPAAAPGASIDLREASMGLAVACVAATIAALLMSWTGGKQRAFADRVVVAALLGVFASGAMLVPAGRWAEFSLAEAAPVVGEVLVGWLLAGMVIAVVIRPRKARA